MKEVKMNFKGGCRMKHAIYTAVIAASVFFAVISFAQDSTQSADNPVTGAPQQAATPEAVQAQAKPQTQMPVQDVVKGTVKEISGDKSFIMVDGTKILTTKEFLEDSYLEVGDKIEVAVEKSEQGLKAKSYNYIFEEEALPMEPEEGAPGEEAPVEK